jgi:hypothetical protein
MTPAELNTHLSSYAAGLEAEIALLHQIEALSTSQQHASEGQDIDHLHRVVDERDRLVAALVQIESQIKDARQLLARHRSIAAALPGFDQVVALHRSAGAIVAGIMSTDRQTLGVLRDAEAARRAASQAIEAGEHTLAAYRRVLAPSAAPSLVDRRG